MSVSGPPRQRVRGLQLRITNGRLSSPHPLRFHLAWARRCLRSVTPLLSAVTYRPFHSV